jgi:cellulose synthase operon protein C
VLYARGSVLHSKNELEAARSVYDATLRIEPEHLEALVARAGIALDFRQYDRAMQDIQVLRKRFPNDPRADYMQAVIAETRGDRTGSQAAMRRVADLLDQAPPELLRFRPQMLMLGGLSHYALNEPQKAKPFLESLVRQQPRNASSKLLAQILFNEGQVENGIAVLETYVRNAPHDLGALALMASGHSLQGRHAKAAQLMGQALRSQDSSELRSVLGQALMRQGKLDEAEQQLALAWRRDPNRAANGTALAMLHLSRGQPAKAMPVAKAVVALNPASASNQHLLGMAQAATNDLKGARASFSLALKLEPRMTEAQLSLARLNAREGDPAGARKLLESLVEADAKAVEPMLELASLARSQGRTDETERWLERAVSTAGPRETRPNFAQVELHMSRGRPAQALEAAKVLYSKGPEDPAVLLVYARAQLASGDVQGARPTLVQAARRIHQSTSQWVDVAALQLEARDLAGASYTLTKVFDVEPDHPRALVLQASIDMARGELKAADERVTRVLKLRPRDSLSHLLAAELSMARKQPSEALASLRKAHELQPSTATAMRLFLHLAGQDAGSAADTFAEAWLRRKADDDTVRRALGEHQMTRERWAGARTHFEELLRRNPNDPQALNNLANILLKLGDAPRALGYSERALKAAPSEAIVLDTHAWALHLNGRHDQALGLLRDARLRAPDNAEIRYHLAAVLAKLGRSAEARAEVRGALQAPMGLESVKDAQRLLESLK